MEEDLVRDIYIKRKNDIKLMRLYFLVKRTIHVGSLVE